MDQATALKLLREAWTAGNMKAGPRLVAIYRDGRGSIKPDRQLAEQYLAEVSSRLPPAESQIERLLMQVATAGPRQLKQIREEFYAIPIESRPAVLRRIPGANRNVYTFLVQYRLGEMKFYDGKLTGVLSRSTANAIYQFCIQHERPEVCGKGPMTPRVIEVTALAF